MALLDVEQADRFATGAEVMHDRLVVLCRAEITISVRMLVWRCPIWIEDQGWVHVWSRENRFATAGTAFDALRRLMWMG